MGTRGGIVVAPIARYGLMEAATPADQAAHVAVGTSLATILSSALVSSLAHRRARNMDIRFLLDWGPGNVTDVIPHNWPPHTSAAA